MYTREEERGKEWEREREREMERDWEREWERERVSEWVRECVRDWDWEKVTNIWKRKRNQTSRVKEVPRDFRHTDLHVVRTYLQYVHKEDGSWVEEKSRSIWVVITFNDDHVFVSSILFIDALTENGCGVVWCGAVCCVVMWVIANIVEKGRM